MFPHRVNETLAQFDAAQILAATSILCGEQLGVSGISRTTFALRYSDDAVIKIENPASGVFQNVIEWRAWQYIQHDERLAQFFAPCLEISQCGTVLIMARTAPLPDDLDEIELPEIIGDYKKMNLGMYKGNPVMHDYGLLNPIHLHRKIRINKVKLDY